MSKIKKAIFPVAGFGTRFLPATKAQPKEMLPIVDKPVIQYLVEEAVESGIKDIVMVTGRGKRAIEDHFDTSFELEHTLVEKDKLDLLDEIKHLPDMANFVYVRQPKPLGDGHAILCAENAIGNNPCAILFGDDIVDHEQPAIKQLIEIYDKTECSVIGLQEVDPKETSSYGIIKGKEIEPGLYEVEDLVEKPKPEDAPSNLAIIGKYVITPEVFPAIKNAKSSVGGELRLIDGFKNLLSSQKIYAKILDGNRFDTGNKFGLVSATIHYAMKNPKIAPELKEFMKKFN
ncbi:UTP--glucose-1-phosphate uridylyltransferase GalU [Candidatus Peregrinibacteria bacterium]|nr:UTP--glucose-1-phosphate uridylyltransferase GalU [Candidatus Peregrinibacteria bacterium]